MRSAGSTAARPFGLFQIEPTLLCTLGCIMCPWRELRQQGGEMSWETFKRIAAFLPLAESVDLTGGGEPLSHPRILDMVQAAKAAGCQVGFSTNGKRLTPQVSRSLVGMKLDWISFSVDAATSELYEQIRTGASFERLRSNIAALRDIKTELGVEYPKMMMVFVMMGGEQGSIKNYPQLPAYIDLAHNLGVEQVIAKNLDVILIAGDDQRRLFSHSGAPADPVRGAVDAAARRAKQLDISFRVYELQPAEQPVCDHNPLQSVFFTWDGHVTPCITLAYAEERFFNGELVRAPCQVFGDINHQDLGEIWENPDYINFRAAFDRRRIWQRENMFNIVLDGEEPGDQPPAPAGCQSCYYLYGI